MKLGTKLKVLFILLGLIPFLIIGIFSYVKSEKALKESAFDELISMRETKKHQIEEYFRIVRSQIITYSENIMISDAMREFRKAFLKIEDELGSSIDLSGSESEKMLRARYRYQKENTPGVTDGDMMKWWPAEKTTLLLQHLYISSNPYPIDEKEKLDFQSDGSTYSKVHAKYHPVIRNFLNRFKYYDIFLVEADTGRIVYSVAKELDIGTSLLNGPYSDSGIGEAFKAALGSGKADYTKLVDFKPYVPSYNTMASFISSPVFDGDKLLGILVFQMPINKVNMIMTYGGKWENVGLGKTGESFLIGEDYKMRNDSRMFIEDRSGFLDILKAKGVSEGVIEKIKRNDSTVGLVEIKHRDAEEALAGETHHSETTVSYLNQPVFIAHAPVDIEGVKWAILTEMNEEEALLATILLRKAMWIFGIIIMVVVFAIALYFARSVSVPINAIVNELSSTSNEIASTINQHERIANQQSSSVNETTTTMDELSASSRQSAEQAEAAASDSHNAMTSAEMGNEKVRQMLKGMEDLRGKVTAFAEQILKLSEQTGQIGNITNMVTDFASETKMLAMNAAVEAVRAGEHGKGFSVVAMEIRKLADESKKSAEKINSLIDDIRKVTNATVMVAEDGTKTVDEGMMLATETADSFNGVALSITGTSENTQQISLNIKQQAVAIKQIVEAMNSLNTGAKETAAGISQTKTAIEKLNEAAQKLKAMV